MSRIRIAVDIMGGDRQPCELARGAAEAAAAADIDVILVGTEEVRGEACAIAGGAGFVSAAGYVAMTDDPGCVMKEKKESSMCVAARLCRDGEADAVVSAGNTGALFTASSLIIRRIKGVRRAALCSVVPLEKPFLLLDCGANLDATPEILRLYAKMGSVYAENVLKIASPRAALLNNGTEPHKGTPLYYGAYELISADESINFIGNCEGKALPFGAADVVVCDGFTGNIALKTIEGMGKFMSATLKRIFYANTLTKLCGLATKKQTDALKKRLDASEYGGAPFLGLAKPVIKAHGSSDARAFRNAILQAHGYASCGAIETIGTEMGKVGEQ